MYFKSVFLYSLMEKAHYQQLKKELPYLGDALLDEISNTCDVISLETSSQIIRMRQYIKVIPIVLEGVIKVLSQNQDKELLLYYIKPNESCVMSFHAAFKNTPSPILAIVEEDAKVLLLPIAKVKEWLKTYPEINTLFYQQYNQRYQDLLDTVNYLVFDKLEVRVYDYLLQKKMISNSKIIKISHRQIASELGTAREVVSRIIKKLEIQEKLIQGTNFITLN